MMGIDDEKEGFLRTVRAMEAMGSFYGGLPAIALATAGSTPQARRFNVLLCKLPVGDLTRLNQIKVKPNVSFMTFRMCFLTHRTLFICLPQSLAW